MIKRLLIFGFVFFLSLYCFAQDTYSTKSKKAIKLFEEALTEYNNRNDQHALELLDNALNIDNAFMEAYLLKANIYHDNRKYNEEISEYTNAIAVNSNFSYKLYYFRAVACLLSGEYDSAKTDFEKTLAFADIKTNIKESTANFITRCNFAINLKNHPVPFNPENIGSSINTEYDEYWPSLTVDEKQFIFTRQIPSAPDQIVTHNGMQEDFYVSDWINGKWAPSYSIGAPINTSNNEGAMSISADGNMFFYTVCNRPEDFGSCDIYYSVKKGGQWTKPKNVGNVVNSRFWESNPSFASDGKTLYFVSNRSGGLGKMDIWFTKIVGKDDKGNLIWSKPENIGDTINTTENEFAPFIHPDNQTLFFTSDGHLGMGGYDIFFSRKNKTGEWGIPENIGYPINTYKDESGMIVNAKGELAYYSSNREKGKGLDIYAFNLYPDAKPILVTYVKGKIYNAETKKPLEADFELIDLSTCEVVVSSKSDAVNGEYLVSLPIDKNYAFNASKDGYLFYSENFSLKDLPDPSKPYDLNIPLQEIKENITVVLNNIFYETDSYELKPESKAELNKLTQFLVKNNTVSIEIGGHTDNVGTMEYNQKLSENRAKTVYEYIVASGIDKSRLSYKGYSFTVPIEKNDTPEGRAKNRRTEFKITSVNKN